ncbi:TPX2-LIKE PROTEIN 3 [Hibiscus trionum]|uniref:TPX2-LIKE PROTEIN 3 n=1 Tax=Hibiscus trionum TaxID=183268 RepID=A0A9W7LH10_HIBTR|nr:TPX2-LIKE PROTEIN 3 [Hibiscus trionum]
MEEEMEIEPVFEVREIDLDYEFDAAQFFDFTVEESPSEARDAELWFESVPSYPPSPFVRKLVLGEDNLLENVTTPAKYKEADHISILQEDDSENVMTALEFSSMNATKRGSNRGIFTSIQKVLQKVLNQPFQLTTGLATSNHISTDEPKAKSNGTKLFMPRSSTLMKPTASQLAKQNHPTQVATSRIKKLQVPNSDRSLGHASVVESQAAKRQKLEGGLTRKVDEVKQQLTLVHKAPKKDGTVHRNTINIKPKLTVPREPELRTAHRAQRTLPKNGAEQGDVTSAMHKFKARPLNRKILEAPALPLPKKSVPKLPEFKEFHLKTSERAVQMSSAVPSSTFRTDDSDKGSVKPCANSANCNGTREDRRLHARDTNYNIKTHPLNKKEFNIHIERRLPQNPPTELFSKLSLTSTTNFEILISLKCAVDVVVIWYKGLKENRLISFCWVINKAPFLHFVVDDAFGRRETTCIWLKEDLISGCMTKVVTKMRIRSSN